MLLDRAVTLDPASTEALEALEALCADAGDFTRLADVLERKLEVAARGPREQKAILARLANIYDRNLSRPPSRAPDLRAAPEDRSRRMLPRWISGAAGTSRRRRPSPSPRRRRLRLFHPRAPGRCRPLRRRPQPTPGDAGAARCRAAEHRRIKSYWRSAGVESEPVLQRQLADGQGASLALARRDPGRHRRSGAGDLLGPRHSGALVLLAEIGYRKQEWPARPRALRGAGDGPRRQRGRSASRSGSRRAALAQRLGDSAEAEALYRELAIFNPRHAEARRVLAELALARGDTSTAALRLEELLRLLPAGSSSDSGRSPPPPRRHLRGDRRVERRPLLPRAGRRPGTGPPPGAGAAGCRPT